ncbi:anti-sigma factor family protein [Aminobacter aganoensis]|uniref:Anti-sigma factor n=1 Tax=Aminobacter aganoensis TaxID=83264 RepID=A0A7X0FCP3_9HYPH|nr:anti-sigma factor [Aminobacter aganoensis]MBB6357053.1 hypothetical protein [Aminobacter aganoensis]
MSRREFDDETLMAFADGELDDDTTATVEAAMETDDDLVARVAAFIESRALAASALKPLIDEPVPEALTQSVQKMIDEARASDPSAVANNVVTFPSRDMRPARSTWAMPLAASLAAVVFGAGGYLAGQAGAPASGNLAMTTINDAEVAKALDSTASGTDVALGDATLKLVSSFRDETGTLCREFELHRASKSAIVSIACRPEQDWDVRLAVAAQAPGGDYVPAGATETVDSYLTTINAGAPLSVAEEKKALALPQ